MTTNGHKKINTINDIADAYLGCLRPKRSDTPNLLIRRHRPMFTNRHDTSSVVV
jgi:hypothetical protein